MCPPSSLSTFDNSSIPTPPNTSNSPTLVLPDCVPKDTMSSSAFQLAHANLSLAILNHSLRVFIYAARLASQQQASIYDHGNESHPGKHALLFITCILHDIGCASHFNGTQRFEVEGADAAKAHVLGFHSLEAEVDAHAVWVAIACHSSPHIAEKISPLAYLVRVAVLFDFHATENLSDQGPGGWGYLGEVLSQELRREVEGLFPRLEPEKALGDAVVDQARRQRGKAPAASWPGILLRAAEEEPG